MTANIKSRRQRWCIWVHQDLGVSHTCGQGGSTFWHRGSWAVRQAAEEALQPAERWRSADGPLCRTTVSPEWEDTHTKDVGSSFQHRAPNTLKGHTLTESCPGIKCGASWSIPGLEGDRTFKEGLSIFWDSKELEPAMKTREEHTDLNGHEKGMFQRGQNSQMWENDCGQVPGQSHRKRIDLILQLTCHDDKWPSFCDRLLFWSTFPPYKRALWSIIIITTVKCRSNKQSDKHHKCTT